MTLSGTGEIFLGKLFKWTFVVLDCDYVWVICKYAAFCSERRWMKNYETLLMAPFWSETPPVNWRGSSRSPSGKATVGTENQHGTGEISFSSKTMCSGLNDLWNLMRSEWTELLSPITRHHSVQECGGLYANPLSCLLKQIIHLPFPHQSPHSDCASPSSLTLSSTSNRSSSVTINNHLLFWLKHWKWLN